jgi:putative DNA-invertase from lambdoid prophage Rac
VHGGVAYIVSRFVTGYAKRAGFEVVEVFKETLSGIRKARGKQPVERGKVMALAQARKIDAVLVTEMTRWGARRKTSWTPWGSS